MASVFYPSEAFIYNRITSGSEFSELFFASPPNSVFVFTDSGSGFASQSYVASSSYALTASYALNGGSGGSGSISLATGSTYPITSSWAISASYAMNVSSGNSESSSWASSSLSASYSDTASYITPVNITNDYSSSVSSQIGLKQDTLTNNLYTITASLATSASYYPTFPTNVLSASWASSSVSASYSETASYANTASYAYTSSYELVVEISSSWASSSISASYSETASYALNIPTGTSTYFPNWNISGSLSSTSLLKTDGVTVSVNEAVPDIASTEALSIKAYDDQYNAVRIVGTVDNYLQVNLQNKNFGTQSSTDFVATADDGTEDNNYIDMGVNSSNYDVADFALQKAHDGYVYVSGGDLIVGTYTTESVVKIHAGGLQQNNLIAIFSEQHGLEASGSFYGTASYAINSLTSSNSNSSSHIIPGAPLYVVSGSNGYAPAYLEPYDYSLDNVYRPLPTKEGRTMWDHKWVDWAVYDDVGARTHLGREICFAVHNPTATALPRFSAVYISGSSPSINPDFPVTYKPDVYLAQADGLGNKSKVVGIIRQAIPSGSDGYILQVGTMHNSDVSSLGPVGTQLWLSPTTPGGITATKPGQPYEVVSLGYIIESGTQGSILAQIETEPLPANAYAGITSTIFLYNNQDGTITMPTGSVNLFDDATGFGRVTSYSLPETQLTLVTGSTNYVIAERSGSVAAQYALTTDSTYANGISIVRVATLDINYKGPGDWDVHEFEVGIVGLALANRSNNKDIRLYGYQRENGLTLYITGSAGQFGITEGNIWYGPNSHTVPTFDTTLSGHYAYIFHTTSSNGTSSWHQDTSSIYVNNYYDNGSDLIPVTPGYYTVNFVYRLMGTEDEAAIVMSSQEFTTSLEASNNAVTPSNLPSTIRDIGLLVGRFVVQSGSFSPLIESAFANTFIPAVVTSHESLTGLQGGQGGEHNHLTLDEYTGTGTGVFLRAYKPVFDGATPYHIPYWDAIGHLTLTGSVQVYEDQYVMINSGSFFDINNPEALLVKQINTSSVNTIGAYSEVNNFSQIYNQNKSSGSNASTDIVATADAGGQETNYIDMGIASSQYNHPTWPWLKALDAYVEVDGGDLWIGTLTDNVIRFMINNTASIGYFDSIGVHVTGSLNGTSSNAISSSWAISASYAPIWTLSSGSTYPITSSWATNAIISNTSLYASQSQWSVSASFASSSLTASYLPSATYQITASWATNAINYTRSIVNNQLPFQINVTGISASFTGSLKGNVIGTASFATNADTAINLGLTAYNISVTYASQSQWAISASFASSSFTASYLPVNTYQFTSSWATNALTASNIDFVPNTANTASYITASNIVGTVESSSYTLSASYAPGALITGNTYTITSSWANNATTSSNANTASYALGIPRIKAGIVSGSIFIGTPRTASIAFGTAFPSINYSVVVTGENSRTWTIQGKSANGFTINANNNTAMTGLVFWQAIIIGEYYS